MHETIIFAHTEKITERVKKLELESKKQRQKNNRKILKRIKP